MCNEYVIARFQLLIKEMPETSSVARLGMALFFWANFVYFYDNLYIFHLHFVIVNFF